MNASLGEAQVFLLKRMLCHPVVHNFTPRVNVGPVVFFGSLRAAKTAKIANTATFVLGMRSSAARRSRKRCPNHLQMNLHGISRLTSWPRYQMQTRVLAPEP